MKKKLRKFKKWFQKIFVVPKYENEIERLNDELTITNRDKDFFKSQMYKKNNQIYKLKCKLAEYEDNGVK